MNWDDCRKNLPILSPREATVAEQAWIVAKADAQSTIDCLQKQLNKVEERANVLEQFLIEARKEVKTLMQSQAVAPIEKLNPGEVDPRS